MRPVTSVRHPRLYGRGPVESAGQAWSHRELCPANLWPQMSNTPMENLRIGPMQQRTPFVEAGEFAVEAKVPGQRSQVGGLAVTART